MSLILEEAIDILSGLTWPDHASSMHAEVAAEFEQFGFDVEFEFPIRDIGNGRRGRIDLVVRKNLVATAVELDCRKPRAKSILKLRNFGGFRLIGLRGVEWVSPVVGIDRIVRMPVREASLAEKRDRRTVNRSAA
jgi:hypothetical protein